MVKKTIAVCIGILILSSLATFAGAAEQPKSSGDLAVPVAQSVEATKDKASRGMNNLLYGPVELPDNIDKTKTKGTEVTSCNKKTRTGVERGIARICNGVWQIATFWYSDPGCVTAVGQQGTR